MTEKCEKLKNIYTVLLELKVYAEECLNSDSVDFNYAFQYALEKISNDIGEAAHELCSVINIIRNDTI